MERFMKVLACFALPLQSGNERLTVERWSILPRSVVLCPSYYQVRRSSRVPSALLRLLDELLVRYRGIHSGDTPY